MKNIIIALALLTLTSCSKEETNNNWFKVDGVEHKDLTFNNAIDANSAFIEVRSPDSKIKISINENDSIIGLDAHYNNDFRIMYPWYSENGTKIYSSLDNISKVRNSTTSYSVAGNVFMYILGNKSDKVLVEYNIDAND